MIKYSYSPFDIFILGVLLFVIFQGIGGYVGEYVDDEYLPFFFKKRRTQKEPLKSITKAFKDLGNKIKNEVTKAINAVKKEINKIKDAILGVFNKIQDTFEEISRVLSSIPVRMRKIEKGFELSMDAIGLEIENLGKGLGMGFMSTFDLIGEGGKTAIGAMECGIEKASWLPQCFPVYLFDGFIYFNKMLFKSIMNASELYFGFNKNFGINYRVIVDEMSNLLERTDAFLYSFSGIHFMHYPEFITNTCYRCKQLETSRFVEKSKKVGHIFNNEIPRLLNEPAGKFKDAQQEFQSAFA